MVDPEPNDKSISGIIIAEVVDDIAMALENSHHFEFVSKIPEENHISLECEATQIRPQFRTLPAQHTRQRCEPNASLSNLGNKSLGQRSAARICRDVDSDIDEMITRFSGEA